MDVEIAPTRRLHGFERPFHPLQVLAWIVFGLDVLAYLVFGLPLVGHDGTRGVVASLYALSVIVLVAATYRATACDPCDPNVLVPPEPSEEIDALPFCGICNVPVFQRSKHCRACAKCVDVFDHHCMWLNNCVGGQNYRAFFVTVSSVSVMIGIILGSCLYLLVDIFANAEEFDLRVQKIAWMEGMPQEFFVVLLITLICINGPLFVLDTQLVVLHIFLSSQNMTTYEYIMNKRQVAEEAEADAEGAAAPPSKRLRTLPHWMDWIVFSRCGRRRRASPAKQPSGPAGRPADKDGSDRKAEAAGEPAAAGSTEADLRTAAAVDKPAVSPEDTADTSAGVSAAGKADSAAATVADGTAVKDVPVPPPAVSAAPPPPPQSQCRGRPAGAVPALVPSAGVHHPGAAAQGSEDPVRRPDAVEVSVSPGVDIGRPADRPPSPPPSSQPASSTLSKL